jgi:2-polyprenyl-6-methoxyphenol hydroxylase-like FAD-dependent oxidoreductase
LADLEISVFDRLVKAAPPEHAPVLLDTACVLGGSVAGLLAARVLAEHARHVVVLERDTVGAGPRAGVPQGTQVHVLLAAGLGWLDRWLPGFVEEGTDQGAVLVGSRQNASYLDDRTRLRAGEYRLLAATRPFLEAHLRARVLALPNVSLLPGRATGLDYRDGGVCAVRYRADGATHVLPAGFVVDAMGRPSKLSEWLAEDGYDQPPLERVHVGINYATAQFKRPAPAEELPLTSSLAQYSPPYPVDGVAIASANAVEDDQWQVLLAGYDDHRPGRTLAEFRATAARMPAPFPDAVAEAPVTGIMTYHQSDSRRRDFTAVQRFPARLVSIGDAVASFNPIYGQGMSSAALQASGLSEYLRGEPDLDLPATAFFRLQKAVVDAAWAVSAGADAARLDARDGVTVPEDVRRQREVIATVLAAAHVDETVSLAFRNVAAMLAHPATLADPALLARAAAAGAR